MEQDVIGKCEMGRGNRLNCFVSDGYKYINNSPALAGMFNNDSKEKTRHIISRKLSSGQIYIT